MGKLIQFRCPECMRLLVKWETGSDKCAYIDNVATFGFEKDTNKIKEVICSKCGTHSKFEHGGLSRIVSDTAELPALANNKEIPANSRSQQEVEA